MSEIIYKEKQKARMERNERIIEEYKKLRMENPGVSFERIFATIATNYNVTSCAIRSICQKSGVYVNRKN